MYTCQLSRIIRESHACWLKTISMSRIKANFSHLTHKSGRVVLKKSSFHFRLVMYYFFALYNNCKSFQMATIRLNQKCSKVVWISSDIFGNIQKSSENRRKSLEVAWTFSEILVMTRQKSHAFDSEKVGRYKNVCDKFSSNKLWSLTAIPLWQRFYIWLLYPWLQHSKCPISSISSMSHNFETVLHFL